MKSIVGAPADVMTGAFLEMKIGVDEWYEIYMVFCLNEEGSGTRCGRREANRLIAVAIVKEDQR